MRRTMMVGVTTASNQFQRMTSQPARHSASGRGYSMPVHLPPGQGFEVRLGRGISEWDERRQARNSLARAHLAQNPGEMSGGGGA
jgi:hypothetical protein